MKRIRLKSIYILILIISITINSVNYSFANDIFNNENINILADENINNSEDRVIKNELENDLKAINEYDNTNENKSNSLVNQNKNNSGSEHEKENKSLLNFKIRPTKEIVFGFNEFDYVVSYEMTSSNQDIASIVVTIPKELEIVSFKNEDINIIEQQHKDNKIFYTLNTKDITNIKGNLSFKVKFKTGTKDSSKAIVKASIQYPNEHIISSNPVIFNNFSVADVNIYSIEETVSKGEEFSYIVNISSQKNKSPLTLTVNMSDTLDILASNDFAGIKPVIDNNANTVTFEIPVSENPISAQFEISVKFKENSQNGAVGNAYAKIESNNIELAKSNSSDTILELKQKLELVKNMMNSTSISPNSISKYRITVKNKDQLNLKGFLIKDLLPKEAIFINAKLKDAKLKEIPHVNVNENNGSIEVRIPNEYKENNIYLDVTVEYKNVTIGDSITNTAEIYDQRDNYINKASITNLVQEKIGQGVISKIATSRINSAGGAQGWNLYIRNDGNVAFDKFILEDNIPYENNLYVITSGKYENFDSNTSITINAKTNKRELKNIITLLGDELSEGKSIDLRTILNPNEYMVKYEVIIENIPVGFTYSGWSCMRLDGNVRNKHEDGTFINNNEKITNTATLRYISDEIKGTVKDSDSFLFKTAYTAYTEKNIIKRSTKINDTAEYELLVKSPKRNLPNPIVFDILPDGMEYVGYEINIKDNKGTIINSSLKDNIKFEQVKENENDIVRWIFNGNLPQNYSISINLTLKQIKKKSFVFNEMGVSTQNINGEIKGVSKVPDNEFNVSIDELKFDTVEPIGYDYDGNGNKGGDIFANATAKYDIGNSRSITARKYIKNNYDLNYSTNIVAKQTGVVNYKLEVENTSNDEIKNLSIIDILPSIGDKNLLNNSDRGSLFTPILVDKFKIYQENKLINTDVKVSYSYSNNPERNSLRGTIGSGVWLDEIIYGWAIRSLKFDFNNLVIKPNDKLVIEYSMIIPRHVDYDIYAINSFQASFNDLDGNLLYPIESNKVIVKTQSQPPTRPDNPVVPPTDSDNPVVPPTDSDNPVVPPTDSDNPVVPPTDPDNPVVPPTDSDNPVVPPTDPDNPVVPPTDPDNPVVPPKNPSKVDKPFKITIDDITKENFNPKTGDDSLLVYIGVSSVCLIIFIIINKKNINKR
ncbi:proline-rich domain-containing protein [Faecalimicrobium sp. JNUCC 81]